MTWLDAVVFLSYPVSCFVCALLAVPPTTSAPVRPRPRVRPVVAPITSLARVREELGRMPSSPYRGPRP